MREVALYEVAMLLWSRMERIDGVRTETIPMRAYSAEDAEHQARIHFTQRGDTVIGTCWISPK